MEPGGFSAAARRAITVALGEALRLGRGCVSVDLIVLGIIDADPYGLAARALHAVGIDPLALFWQIAGPDGSGVHSELAPESPHVPFCCETREAMKLAVPERDRLRHDQVDTVHLLLALTAGAEPQMTDLLSPYGVHPRQLRTRVIRLVAKGIG